MCSPADGCIAALGALSQLQDLQLKHVASAVTVSQLGAALLPLTRLTRLSMEFGNLPHHFEGHAMDCLPDAVCALTGLRSLRFGGLEFGFGNGMTPSLTQLRRLEDLELRGWVQQDLVAAAEDMTRPMLFHFPALQAAVLRLRVQVGHNTYITYTVFRITSITLLRLFMRSLPLCVAHCCTVT